MLEVLVVLLLLVFSCEGILFMMRKEEKGPHSLQRLGSWLYKKAWATFFIGEMNVFMICWILFEFVLRDPWNSIVAAPLSFSVNMLLTLTFMNALISIRVSGYHVKIPGAIDTNNEIFEAEVLAWANPYEGFGHVQNHIYEKESKPDQVYISFLRYVSTRTDQYGNIARQILKDLGQ